MNINPREKEPEQREDDPDIRNRFNSAFSWRTEEPDIGNIWAEQEKRLKEDKELELKYKQTRKEAKLLKRQIRENYIGETKVGLSEVSDRVITATVSFRSRARIAMQRLGKVVGMLPLKVKLPVAGLVLFVVIVGFTIILSGGTDNNVKTLGDNTNFTSEVLPREDPTFTLLYPEGKGIDDYEIVRVSPSGNDPAYAYLESVGGAQFTITQQQLPSNFEGDTEARLKELANDFEATNVITIDNSSVYYGFSEKAGIQSVILVKNQRLIFIRVDQKVTDNTLATFIISLN